jgi:drug/metabolite transporter (DMT)-like permease
VWSIVVAQGYNKDKNKHITHSLYPMGKEEQEEEHVLVPSNTSISLHEEAIVSSTEEQQYEGGSLLSKQQESEHTELIAANVKELHQEQEFVQTSKQGILQLSRQWFLRFTTSQLFAHMLLLFNCLLYGGFHVLSVQSLKQMHPIIFSTFRTYILAVTMMPIALFVDRKHTFVNEADEPSSSLMTSNKFTSIIHWIWCKVIKSKIPANKKDILWLLCIGCILGLNIFTFIVALSLVSPIVISVISPSQTVFTCLIAVLLKREGRSLLKFAGVFLAVAGSISTLVISALLKKDNNTNTETGNGGGNILASIDISSLLGCSLMIANTLGSAIYLIVQKSLLDKGIPPMTLTAWTCSVASIAMTFISAFFFPSFHPSTIQRYTWITLLYAGLIIGTLSYTISAYAAKFTSPTVISVYNCIMPIVSSIFMYLFLGQTVTWVTAIGAILITAGVLMVGIAKQREQAQQKLLEQKGAELKQSTTEELQLETEDIDNEKHHELESVSIEPTESTEAKDNSSL